MELKEQLFNETMFTQVILKCIGGGNLIGLLLQEEAEGPRDKLRRN